jgi:hypothetical protein
MPAALVANLSLDPNAVDQTGHGQPCVEQVYTDVEGLFGEPGVVYRSAVQTFQHGGQKLAISIGNAADPAKAIFEQFASAQTVPAGKILVR